MALPEKIDWAVVFATLFGPISAVIITLWAQARDGRRRNRMDLFSNMMRSRRNPISTDFVGSLNLVPVHFHADRVVIQKYAELIALFDDNAWRSGDGDTIRRINEKVELAIAYLLSAMSRALGVPIEQLAILRGAYAPQGWADEEQQQRGLRTELRKVLTGEFPLRVLALQVPPMTPATGTNERAGLDEEEARIPSSPGSSTPRPDADESDALRPQGTG